ncbi:transposase [Mariniflexile sp.]|uniref:transposase n=1 Tax=Mariniflexile sp. TaxID=1979402 RepID=UPI0040477192
MYKESGTLGLFSEENRLEKLSRQGDPLERLDKVVDWEYFRDVLEKSRPKKFVQAGPRSYDPVLMFKILVLQRYYNLSDGQMEYQILDWLTFCRFLGITINDRVPDEKTIWLFREKLVAKGLERELFDLFATLLEKHGLIANEGKLIDASFVPAPRQRNNRDGNKKIKDGKMPFIYLERSRKAQTDIKHKINF